MQESRAIPIVEVRYSEISLKKGNRRKYEVSLLQNLRDLLDSSVRMEILPGRITLSFDDVSSAIEAAPRIAKTFGVRWAGLGWSIPRDLNLLKSLSMDVVREHCQGTFKLDVKRVDKSFPSTSIEMERTLGHHICSATGLGVDLKAPQLTIHITLLEDRFLLTWKTFDGPGGIPVGATGRVVVLLSGGIDSPVASYMMMKRGCLVNFLHFYSLSSVDEVRGSKIHHLAIKLLEHSRRSRVYLSDFSNFLRYVLNADPRIELVLFRRYMLRVAEELCKRDGSLGIVTGDSLGQVASQTLENLLAASYGLRVPVYRPLIGMNKEEIIKIAKEIGTYDISIKEYKDCCSILTKRPKTKTTVEEIIEWWTRLNLDECVEKALEGLEELELVTRTVDH
ncbi:MAG: tRNA 4-thiouridine(8) synthase ThiI [Aigarchaeota archaeon]|nr:tRNA 4-thiouridine(8) synthase ThiI [Aigarchaeota archaeon]MDW8092956.1 tRNA uracil 4-sulfurtransferase ThiI [Nitrososphaerota archaeon]